MEADFSQLTAASIKLKNYEMLFQNMYTWVSRYTRENF